ncbi:MAG: DUF2867 domain-containing protein [Verrucomicrobia bacterium]|nr:DUF2867 domain-containing protein [Verrucomicrobiota bacterium]MCH8513472.1 SDR family oxidoreductase [Kiritimatiellia bacterium]
MSTSSPNPSPLILVTGATGYVGGRLVPHLLEAGYRVRTMARSIKSLEAREWASSVEIVKGDVLDAETLDVAMDGVDSAFYLIHSLGGGSGYAERDVTAAENFSKAAQKADVKRIIYLGGIFRDDETFSEHLRSRRESGEALRRAGVPVTEFRAGVIVGSGSLSFEIIRYLTERVPFMICPRWVYTRAQPIGIRDVLAYLTAALDTPESTGKTIEIGGAEVVTYGDMMIAYAKARGLRRRMIPVPILTPRLSSYWVDLVTPIPAAIARPLIQGLRNEVVVEDDSARTLFPDIVPVSFQTALERAVAKLDNGEVETAWTDATNRISARTPAVELTTKEGMILERRQRIVAATPQRVFQIFTGIGGDRGWFFMNGAWRIRGAMDRLVGGVGLRRGRRDPDDLRPGDALDFWRVEKVEPDHLLRLRAEMKVPGRAWLEFETVVDEQAQTHLSQTAFFAPKGLSGLLYWYLLYPLHALIFSGLIREITRRAEADLTATISSPPHEIDATERNAT